MTTLASVRPLVVPKRTSSQTYLAPVATCELSVVIVNYQQWRNTASLIKQLYRCELLRREAAEVVIIDNHSLENPVSEQLRRCRGISLRLWGQNRGFACAVNEGVRLSRGEWVLLLNPDMSVPDEFLDQILVEAKKVAALDGRMGLIGFALRNSDGTEQGSTGDFPTFTRTLAGLGRCRSKRKYRARGMSEKGRVDWVTGCCMLIHRDCLESLGGLDPSFFLYYEDVDLCRRAKDAGYSVWFAPEVSATHHNPLHERTVPPALRAVTRHSLLTYCWKHWPQWQFRFMTRLVQWEASCKRLVSRLRGDQQGRDAFQCLEQIARQMRSGDLKAARKNLQQITQRL